MALEQRHPELVLEPLDAPAERRLADVQSGGRAADVPLLGHLDERLELRERHT